MNEKWKAVEPKETLNKIDDILTSYHIYSDIHWYNTKEEVQSCRLTLLNRKGVNGKGTTLEYTLASGKAELLERLQTFQLCSFKPQRCFKDEVLIGSNFFLPYFNCIDNTTHYFPTSLPNSNGLASGNTIEEAIVHGLCEIIERYMYIQLGNQNLSFHKELEIPQKYQKILDKIKMEGILIDISNFGIPIVLLLVQNEDFIDIEIDCGPTIDLAIERCFTEMVQGINLNNEIDSHLSIVGNNNLSNEDFIYELMFFRQISIPQRYINYLLNCRYDKKEVIEKYNSNKELIQIIIKNTKDIFGNIFIRDYSFLGFPTVRCTIENNYDNYLDNHELRYNNFLSYLNNNLIMYNNPNLLEIYLNALRTISYSLNEKNSLLNKYNNEIFNILLNKSLDFQMDMKTFENIIKEI